MTGLSPPELAIRCTSFLRNAARAGDAATLVETRGKLTRVAGLVMEATGLKLPLGSVCTVEQREGGTVEAEVVGFAGERLFLMPVSDIAGVSPGALVRPVEPQVPRPRVGATWHPRRRASDLAKHLPVGGSVGAQVPIQSAREHGSRYGGNGGRERRAASWVARARAPHRR